MTAPTEPALPNVIYGDPNIQNVPQSVFHHIQTKKLFFILLLMKFLKVISIIVGSIEVFDAVRILAFCRFCLFLKDIIISFVQLIIG